MAVLSDRRQRVLSALIEEYVERALPVGSRTLTERYQLGVSPATVRNELSALEEQGYISQPHTSSGRIPTDFGYRAFVDELISSGVVQDDERSRAAVTRLRNSARELDDLMEQTSAALSHLTDCLSIVLAPVIEERKVRQITMISLDAHHAVIVIVTKSGDVLNRKIDFKDEVSADELSRIQRLLNNAFCARLSEAGRISDIATLLKSDAAGDPLTALVIDEILDCLNDSDSNHSHRLGMSSLMKKPEFSRSESLLPIIQAFDDDTVLLELMECSTDDMPIVKIGTENSSKLLSGVSIIASRYGRGENEGVVAVIGPTRMDYSRALKAVHMASSALDED